MYDVTPGQIREWNNIRGDAIQVGKSLAIRPVKPVRQAAKKKTVKEDPKRYVVQQGEGIWGIAQAHGVPVDSLIAWNSLSAKTLRTGQVLTLVPPSAAEAKQETYTVTAHDKLSSIARKFKIDVNELRAWNDIKGNDIREGQVLRLCKPAAPAVHARSAVRVQGSNELVPHTHIVETGETLYGISRKLGVKVEDLRTWNNINNDIRAGQKLVWYDSTVD
jgi:membrane-bound lytic murein transglycosylase D